MLKKAIAIFALCACAAPALAQAPSQTTRKLPPRPALTEAKDNTLQMTCEQGRKIVQSSPQGVVLRTGATRWERYYHDAEFCGQDHLVPEFVRTKDSQACMIGFSCHTVAGDGAD